MKNWCFAYIGIVVKSPHEAARQSHPVGSKTIAAQRLSSTRRCSQPEPAGWARGKSNVIGGCLRWLTFTLGGNAHMFAIGLQKEEAPPTIAQYVFGSLFGLFFLVMAVWMIIALFSDRQRSRFHHGKGRGRTPVSR